MCCQVVWKVMKAGLLGKETLLAHVRESAEELTLRMEEACSRPSWMPPWRRLLLDEDWHLLCQAVHAEAQQQDWQGMCEKFWGAAERPPSHHVWSRRASPRALESFRLHGEQYFEAGAESKVEARKVRQELLKEHMKDPAATVYQALKSVEARDEADSSSLRS